MKVLGEYLLRGWLQGVTVVVLLTVVSLFVMPLAFLLSGAPVALVTLRRGPKNGLQVIAGATAIVALMLSVVGLGPLLALAFALTVWLPVWLCCCNLRRTESQAAAVMTAALVAALFAVGMQLMLPDAAAWWQGWLETWLRESLADPEATRYQDAVKKVAPMLNALMAGGMMLSLVAAVLVARVWQASMFNPGGFRREFHALRMPRALVAPVVVAGFAAALAQGIVMSLARDLMIIGLFAFLFHGVAAVHRTVAQRRLNRGWLAGMYVLMVLLPHVVLFLACIGLVDAWLGGEGAGGTA